MSAMAESPQDRAAWLREELQRHERLYYQEAKPEITDREFDRLMAELAAIEEEHPELRTTDSPTRRVGGEPTEGFEQVEHEPPMLSLDNTYDNDELQEWAERLERLLPDTEIDFVCELKVDGVSLSLLYEDGVLTEAATRGNGRDRGSGDGQRADDPHVAAAAAGGSARPVAGAGGDVTCAAACSPP